LRAKPTHVELGCGHHRHHNKQDLRRIHYRGGQYGRNKVRGRADVSIPSTAGNPHRVKVAFKRLRKCGKREAYRRVTYKFSRGVPSGEKRSNTFRLGCHR
jgi:hypothetical protein